MVDYNNETTISKSPVQILQVTILEYRKYFLEAWEHYQKLLNQHKAGVNDSKAVVKSRIQTLYLELKPSIKNAKHSNFMQELHPKVHSDKPEDWLIAFDMINHFLYEKKLTQWDTMRRYDPSSVEDENSFHGVD